MEHSKPQAILSFSHTDYRKNVGGLEKFIVEQSQISTDSGFSFIGIFPVTNSVKIVGKTVWHKFLRFGVIVNKNDAIYVEYEELMALLSSYNIVKVFIHTLIGWPLNMVGRVIDSTGCEKIYYYVHDYASLCFNHVLLKNKQHYCGDKSLSFKKCCGCRYYPFNILHGNKYRDLFEKYPSLNYIFPSEISQKIWSETYKDIPEVNKHVIPHQKFSNESIRYRHDSDIVRIAYVGYKAANKGWTTFKRLVTTAQALKLPYRFYVLGKSDEILPEVEYVDVSFQKNGPDAMVNAIREHNIDISFLWSPWPETYSYTFFESYVGGSFIVTNKNSGNIAYQTRYLNCGMVFDDEEALLSSIGSLKEIVLPTERPVRLIPRKDFLSV